eukprot:9155786-Pyramimonas_sp.AAC.1
MPWFVTDVLPVALNHPVVREPLAASATWPKLVAAGEGRGQPPAPLTPRYPRYCQCAPGPQLNQMSCGGRW